jgi:hypothetical protein
MDGFDLFAVFDFSVERPGGNVRYSDQSGIAGMSFLKPLVNAGMAFAPKILLMAWPDCKPTLAIHSTSLKFLAIHKAILF